MATTVDGLVSGLDTTTIISQLMQIQAAPQTRLKTSLTQQQSALSALQSVNTKMTNLQAAAENLQKLTTWGAARASSSSSAVTATAAAGALSGSTTFSVVQLATAQSSVSSATFSSLTSTSAITDSGFEIHRGSGADAKTITIATPTDGSLQALVTAINSTSDAGVRAAAVQVSPGQYRLQLSATDTGEKNAFTLTGTGGAALGGLSFTQVNAAQDAKLHVGDVGAGFDITSASNTVEGVMPGVTVKVSAKANDVTLSVDPDQAAITSAVQALVDAANSALVGIKSVSSNGVVGTDGTRSGVGALAGDGLMRQLTSQILSKVTAGVGGKSLSTAGIGVNKDGIVTFDKDKFAAAMTADPAGTQSMFTTSTTAGTGFADVVAGLAKDASSSSGTIASAVTGRQSTISDLTDRIAGWDVTLAARQSSLQKQYSALEVALGKLKSQSTWLAGQINQLSNSGSNS
ncbi:flagellar filament capping protein FliD [Angustibacter luteus]|uniref:Flagellar hook-associated protein 2 n=1 Tax=Angustibacter luteus TaxID=658456 RepID=A0ABW1JGV1_9ACTN